ncbi:hypothetical protein QWY93_17620 [Echinicola jeungdonensis]|uniref:Uncharacterized protein n=1 Tax=Echinicola jeungdonensis TaxID=709343 RepID=A0ABV5J0B5_9BACT|nr:hypothetical protein [Echinicola jeungdonensis]MDN3671135.1 hypothetical protein [Echinicola jeungdonensis]
MIIGGLFLYVGSMRGNIFTGKKMEVIGKISGFIGILFFKEEKPGKL